MFKYIIKRLLLIIPTLLGIIALNFFITQFAPGGPVKTAIARIKNNGTKASEGGGFNIINTKSFSSVKTDDGVKDKNYGIDPEIVKKIEKMYGFDKPVYERFFTMLLKYLRFDLGDSYTSSKKVIDIILEKMPVSISLGLWATILIYSISIPLGIKKAIKDGSKFDLWSSTVMIIGYSIPAFLIGIILIIFFSGGSFIKIFPMRNIVSDNWASFSTLGKIADYAWHVFLPVISMTIGGFAGLTMLTKNCFLDEINKQYVITARSKGLKEKKILYGHIFRNAMILVITGLPGAFISIFFTGSLLIEVAFNLDGIGLLSYESAKFYDYPVLFGLLYIGGVVGLVLHLVSDILYTVVDPRIDFETREV